MEPTPPVLAAGAVVWREMADRLQLLLVHRPRYADWTFPKGKLDPGERLPVTAVRETTEETGVDVRLGVPLLTLEYPLRAGGTKRVSYWCARPVEERDLDYQPNDEIDGVRWVDIDETASVLSYDNDRQVLSCFAGGVAGGDHLGEPLILLRHAKAGPRRRWHGNDRRRPLADQGRGEAERLVPLLAAYGVRNIVSSDSTRCLQTVQPYASAAGLEIVADRALSQEDATRKRIAKRLPALLGEAAPTVICTHRPVLPLIYEQLGLAAPTLETAHLHVLHRRDGSLIEAELHLP